MSPAKAVISEMVVLPRSRNVRFVRPAKVVISGIVLLLRSRNVRFVSSARVVISERLLLLRSRCVRFVSSARVVISERLLLSRYRRVSVVIPAMGVMSERLFWVSSNLVRLIAYSSPVRSLIPMCVAVRFVNVSISEIRIASPAALPRAVSMALRNFVSDMFTSVRLGV